jgi:RimJ/RimL family protein N-acetyltransferase
MNYPAWSQNIIMMLEANDGQQSYTIGMVSAYHCNYRNMVVKAGILIDKQVRNQQTSSRCMEMWVEYLFNHCNFRKVVCEIIEDRLAQPLLDRGFVEEGRYRQEVCVDRNYTDEIRLACLSKDFHLKLAPKKKTTVKLVKVDGGQS